MSNETIGHRALIRRSPDKEVYCPEEYAGSAKMLQARHNLGTRACEKTSQTDELCPQRPEVRAKSQDSNSGEELLFDCDVIVNAAEAAEAAELSQNLQPMSNKQLPNTVWHNELVLVTQAAAQEGTLSALIHVELLPVEDPDCRAPSPGFWKSDLDTIKVHTPSESIPILAPLQVMPSHNHLSIYICMLRNYLTASPFCAERPTRCPIPYAGLPRIQNSRS